MTRTWNDLTHDERNRLLGKPTPPEPRAFNGTRIKQARELQGMSRESLAERLDTDVATIALIEDGGFQPCEDIRAALVMILGFPLRFFKLGDPPALPMGTLLLHEMASGYLCDICDAEMEQSVLCPECGKDMCPLCQVAREGRALCVRCAGAWDAAHTPKVKDYWKAPASTQRQLRTGRK